MHLPARSTAEFWPFPPRISQPAEVPPPLRPLSVDARLLAGAGVDADLAERLVHAVPANSGTGFVVFA